MPTSTTAKSGRATMRVTTPSRAELEAMVRRAMGPAIEELVTVVDEGRFLVRVGLKNSSGYAQFVKSARFGRELRRGQFRHVLSSLRARFKVIKKDLRGPVQAALAKSLNGSLNG
jgi:hypothetical protein